VKNATKVVLKAQQSCFKAVMAGKLTGVNCDDVHDPAFPGALKVQAAANKAVALASSGCALASSPQTNGYVFCPSPCGAISISGYSDVANCLVCIAESESSIADNSAYGTPPPAPSVLNQKCQIQVGKAFQKYSDTRAKVQQTCQFAEDISPLGTNCRIADPKGTVAKAVIKLKLSIAKCTDAGLAGLDSCGNNVNGEQSCIQGATELMVDNLFADVYTPAGTSAVFVSSNVGTPGGSGTIASPVDTITGGLSIAIGSGAANVFIDGGAYSESLSLVSGINLVGGFNSAGGWIHDGSATTVFGGTTGVLGSFVADVVIDGLSVHAAGNGATGGSSYGFRLVGSTNVMIKGGTVVAGSGGSGTNGGNGGNGFAGGVGGNGGGGCEDSSIFCDSCSRPGGGSSGPGAICNGGGGGGGGGGGQPGKDTSSGNPGGGGGNGSGAAGSSAGGSGGSGGGASSAGFQGGVGSPGNAGSDGSGGADFGGGVSTYTPANGSGGGNGSSGGGGGGGGGGAPGAAPAAPAAAAAGAKK
jgi:hypothetical protein